MPRLLQEWTKWKETTCIETGASENGDRSEQDSIWQELQCEFGIDVDDEGWITVQDQEQTRRDQLVTRSGSSEAGCWRMVPAERYEELHEAEYTIGESQRGGSGSNCSIIGSDKM